MDDWKMGLKFTDTGISEKDWLRQRDRKLSKPFAADVKISFVRPMNLSIWCQVLETVASLCKNSGPIAFFLETVGKIIDLNYTRAVTTTG